MPERHAGYATLDGAVRLESFRPEVVTIVGRDGRTQFEYWHIRPAVAHGTHVTAYRTLIGWTEPPWEHVHFSERRDGVYVNPLRPGALGPFSDTTRPWVKAFRVDDAGPDVDAVGPTARSTSWSKRTTRPRFVSRGAGAASR